ncbi:MAG TPA: STAS domain-containing protein [Chthoniobacteraceae bacterium]|nr:STAS domain-containing protein [Chthoniobacteraceae bacterium]
MATISNPEPDFLVLEGEIDLSQSAALRQAFGAILESRPKAIFIDMTGVTYIDSSGLACLIEAMQRLRTHEGQLALFGIHENVQNIFEIARLDLVFRIFPDRASAEKELVS